MQALFEDIWGNKLSISTLISEIETNQLAQGYLFSGVEEVGKFMVAKRFAVAVQLGKEYESKKTLRKLIENGKHIETKIWLNNDGKSIKIEEVRNLIYELQLSTNEEKKIILIEDAERLTMEAANALLKSLEEPNSKVMFILTSSKEDMMPQTVISRLRVLRFKCLIDEEMKLFIKHHFPLATNKMIEDVLSISNGRPGLAKKLLQNPDLFGIVEKLVNEIEDMILNKDLVNGIKLAQEFAEEKALARIFLKSIEISIRRIINKKIGINKLVEIVEKLYESTKNIETNANVRMLLESIVFSIA